MLLLALCFYIHSPFLSHFKQGCGKTVQVLSLLTALYGKTGTGTDLAELIRRRTLVKAKKKIRKKKEEEAAAQRREEEEKAAQEKKERMAKEKEDMEEVN